jgi:hypothetical protein
MKSLGPSVSNLANDAASGVANIAKTGDGPTVTAGGDMQQVLVTGKRQPRDFRVRLAPQTKAITKIYGEDTETNLLSPLRETRGLMFPFTPTIEWSQSVNYKTTSLVHSNQDVMSYENKSYPQRLMDFVSYRGSWW